MKSQADAPKRSIPQLPLRAPSRLPAKLFMIALCVEAIFSVGYRTIFLAVQSPKLAWVAGIVALLFASICYKFRAPILAALGSLCGTRWLSSRAWFWFCLFLGILLRVAWVFVFPSALKSDGRAYFTVAQSLAIQHQYPGAFWPPGYPLFLSVFFMVFGAHEWVCTLCSLLLFCSVGAIGYLLAIKLANKSTAGIAIALLAVWPGYVTTVGINSKEGFVALLLPAAMFLYLRSIQQNKTEWTYLSASGIVLGLATLTQPGCILFPLVILVADRLRTVSVRAAIPRIFVFSIAMLVAILPWTYRNYHSLHKVMLISSNGGSVFYRANNPLANASYSPEGEIHLSSDGYAADREGYKEGEKWIVEHPGHFAILAIRKQVGYLGDDGIGVYETLKRDAEPSAKLYAVTKGICSLFWLGLWVVLLLGVPLLFKQAKWPVWYGICFLPVVYQWGIDSIFESGSRHHLSDVVFIAVLVGMVLCWGEPDEPRV